MTDKCKTCLNGNPSISCVNCGSGFRNYHPYKPPTNADRIRAMSDEELAECVLGPCQFESSLCIEPRKGCKECTLDWLKQPVKEAPHD
ncbi:hypothetical protein SDC9_197105 [bioreactor metagenome]|uniref:Uncharacterized protein n=1 Tax=bioreactor metagenome TaxID=1076179 RepID=A0A645IME4_9ZZZZ